MGGHYRYNPGMPVKRVLAKEGAELLAKGYKYVDVRSIPEFDAGHPEGAYNVPILHLVPGRGKMPNPEFQAVMEKRFPRDEKLLLGCASGARSLRAAEILLQAGWTDVVDFQPGFEGWRHARFAVETAAPGRTWEELKK
jgi:rhodanese-related sulfurtransferase